MVYALDFDGVVCDSIHECFENSYHAFLLTYKLQRLPVSPDKFWKEKFYSYRGVVRPSKNFYYLWKLIVENQLVPHNVKASFGLGYILEEFDLNLSKVRNSQIRESLADFIDLNGIFDNVLEVWNSLPRPLFVVTAKDEKLVRILLDFHRLSVDGIYGKGSGEKHNTLQKLAMETHIEIAKVKFVDDNPRFVEEAKSVGIDAALALWGYGPYESREGKTLSNFREVLDFFNNG
jgi:phosphoglycolate phosphatase-like HAD superfamily hydrolase